MENDMPNWVPAVILGCGGVAVGLVLGYVPEARAALGELLRGPVAEGALKAGGDAFLAALRK